MDNVTRYYATHETYVALLGFDAFRWGSRHGRLRECLAVMVDKGCSKGQRFYGDALPAREMAR